MKFRTIKKHFSMKVKDYTKGCKVYVLDPEMLFHNTLVFSAKPKCFGANKLGLKKAIELKLEFEKEM